MEAEDGRRTEKGKEGRGGGGGEEKEKNLRIIVFRKKMELVFLSV